MPKKDVFLKIVILFSALHIFSSCTFYENVTGYFNTYYNAKKNFDDAITEIEKNPQKGRDTNYFAVYTIPKSASDKLDKVIEKSSKLIQLYPQCSWIDDALLMIGKSYVYKGESESAIRKFKELLDNFPDSDLCGEAKMLLAVSEYQSKHDDEGLRIAKEVFTESEITGENDRLIQASMLQGRIYFEREDYNSAVEILDKASTYSGDNALLAEVQFQRGVSYERLGNQSKSAEAYGGVASHGSSFSKVFQARLRQGAMLAREHRFEEAFDVFSDLQGEALKPDERALVELGIGNTYKIKGDTLSAFEIYERIDTLYKRTDAAAKSFYERGLTFEKEYPDYKRAAVYYEKAKSEFTASEITPLATKRYLALSNYFKLTNSLIRYDSLIELKAHLDTSAIETDSLALTDSIENKTIGNAPEHVNDNKLLTPQDNQNITDISDAESYDNLEDNLEPLAEEQSLQSALFSRRESGIASRDYRQDRMGDRIAGQLRPGEAADSNAVKLSQKDALKAPASDPLLKVSIDSLNKLIGQTKFELGAHFYLEMDLPDSALIFYWDVVDNYSSEQFAPRACYAMVEIYNEESDSIMADSVKNILFTQYENSEYTSALKKSIGQEVTISVDPIDSIFTSAYQIAMEGKLDTAMKIFDQLAINYPTSPFASKSLFTIAWLLENDSKNDSATFWYKKLIKEYPTSVYAVEAKPKVSIKDDPKSADQLIKIKEIPSLGKTAVPKKETTKTADQDKKPQVLQPIPLEEDPEEDTPPDEEEEEEPPPDDDEGGGI
ncbi:MAG: tetratricopeptide repeat protein [Ignavibacteriales bacterium]|nr:tetratricopeptide repeat protein [Ignavibacteriales bacterium]